MEWMNSTQVAVHLDKRFGDFSRPAVSTAYALSMVAKHALPTPDFSLPGDIHEFVPLTPYAEQVFRSFDHNQEISPPMRSFVALLVFFHRDCLVDCCNINKPRLTKMIDDLLMKGTLVLPDRFGRSLYDRFNSKSWGDRLEFLEPGQVTYLLQNGEPGVYQLGNIVTGPLGLLHSEEQRLIPPSRSIPLWHCADPGCGVIHSVELLRHPTKAFKLVEDLKAWLTEQEGLSSEWLYPCNSLLRNPGPRRIYDILPLIGDAIPRNERTALLAAILTTREGARLREIVSTHLGDKSARGGPEQIAQNLPSNTQLQLIATLSDETITESVDNAVRDELIKIPQSEVRKANMSAPKGNSGDLACSLSVLGIRSDRKDPARFFSALIYKSYEQQDALSDLMWRADTESASPAAVFEFVRRKGPEKQLGGLLCPVETSQNELQLK